jgi:ABC-type lipoprotein export system ATPase subunit
MSADQRARIRNAQIGFVFQNFNLLARTSALENVELPMLYGKRMSSRARHDRAKELLSLVGLGDRLDHHPGQLSGGQQQRVAIARALATEPSILMGDEPTGNLFRQLNENKSLTVILVTHDLAVAKNARRNIVLRDGKIIADTRDHDLAATALRASSE